MAPRIASILLLWIRRVETQLNKHGIYKRVSIVVVGAVLYRHIYISSSNLSESTPQKQTMEVSLPEELEDRQHTQCSPSNIPVTVTLTDDLAVDR